MRILQLGKFYPIRGGVEKVMYDLTVGLSTYGVECDMLCAAYKGKGRTMRIGKKARLICCRSWMQLAGTMISPSLVIRTMRTCRDYDAIHVHHPDPMACLALFCAGYRGKVILHWHSDIVKQKMWLKFYRPLQRWLLRRADMIVGTSPAYLAGSPYLRCVRHKLHCLPIGIQPIAPDDDRVAEIQSCYQGRRIIFSLGRLVHYKGFEYLIQSARFLDDDFVVLIGGEGPLRSQLEREIETWGLEGKVVLLGRVSDEHLPAYFGACTVFCLPSVQKTEAFGIVQIEAMSCGKPVVATDIPGSGVPWVNRHGCSGLNVPPQNPAALAVAIREITQDRATYQSYAKNALERYQTVFTQEKMINDYFNILWKCLNL